LRNGVKISGITVNRGDGSFFIYFASAHL